MSARVAKLGSACIAIASYSSVVPRLCRNTARPVSPSNLIGLSVFESTTQPIRYPLEQGATEALLLPGSWESSGLNDALPLAGSRKSKLASLQLYLDEI